MVTVETIKSRRIAGNTVALFLRQIAVLAINLYMIRVLLQTLGVEDYAVYAVVYNLIMMTSFLWGSIQTITQRFFAYAIGAGDIEKAKACYDANIILCFGVALLAWAALETVGVWFITEKMNVAADRLDAALFMFRAYFVFALLKIFSTFFASVIMAHEDMRTFALISILEAFLRVCAAVSLTMLPFDPLITFAVLFSVIEVFIASIFALLVITRYRECSLRLPRLDVGMLREMLRFSGWTVFGQITTISRNQAITILINQAFSPATVAARVLAFSVGSQVLAFSTNFSMALNPPITKSWASGAHDEMYRLIFLGSKIAFYLVWVATLPILATLPGILTLWLGEYPAETVIFTRLALIENAIVALAFPLMAAVRATGDMRAYELILGSMQIMVLLASWVLIIAGFAAVSVYVVAIVVNILMFGTRLALASAKTGLPAIEFLREVIGPVGLVTLLSSLWIFGVLWIVPEAEYLEFSLQSFCAVVAIYVAPAIIALGVGLDAAQRAILVGLISKKLGARGAEQ